MPDRHAILTPLRADSPPPARTAPAQPAPRLLASSRAIVALAMAVSLLACAAFAVLVAAERRAALRNGEATVQALAATLAVDAQRFLEIGSLIADDAIALARGREWAALGASRDAFASLQRLQERSANVSAIWLADDTGIPRLSSRGFPAQAESVAEDPAFIAHAKAENGLLVSRIAEDRTVHDDATGAARPVHEASLGLSRRISGDDGAFRGIASVVLNPHELMRAHADAAPPYPLTFALFTADGSVLLRGAGEDVAPGERAVDPAVLRVAPTGSVVQANPGADDGQLVAYRAVGNLPLYVGVGVNADDLLAAWRRATLREAAFLIAALSCVLLFMAIAASRVGSAARLADERAGEPS